MKLHKNKESLIAEKHIPFLPLESKNVLPPELATRFDLYPENKRRPVNKILFRNDYFQLTYSMKENSTSISSRGDIVYSAIPYDTARNYIQRAAIQYLLHPEEVRQYIKSHKATLEIYLIASIKIVTKKLVDKNSFEVIQAYNAIFQNPLFEIQILGRLLQHDETGALSANLAGKFLFSENVKTGISEYVSEYLRFFIKLSKSLPIMFNGKNIQLLETKQSIENSIVVVKQSMPINNKPILRSEFGRELSEVRKNYIAHSVNPKELEQYFENVLSIENTNLVNVVSDIHTKDGKLPLINKNFNILVGDISDSYITNEEIRGLYVIGNHELVDVLPDSDSKEDEQWEKWSPFFENEWFKKLLQNPNESWYMLPIGDHGYYEIVKAELEKRFPKISLLNNSSIIHNDIRYVGLTIPVALVERKKEQQGFILKSLKKLLDKDYDIPTVIVSHAPLFNELSMLSPKSKAYNRNYICSEPKIEKLFEKYNIVGAIHGHHHIPASLGQYKIVKFAGKELFVVCSIYSKINTGFELMSLINPSLLST